MALRSITVDSSSTIKVLVIGIAGIGKTSLIRTIPEGALVIVISAESGLLSVRDLILSGRIQGYEVYSFDDLREAFLLISRIEVKEGLRPWIVIDSLTELASRCYEAMKAKYPSHSDGFKLWQEYNEKMIAMIKTFRDLPDFNVAMTALETCEKDEMNRRYYGVAMSGGQLKERLSSYFDEVFHMTSLKQEDGAERRVFITQPWERHPAKDRSGKLDLFEKPDLGYIRDKILNSVEEKE